MGQADGYEHYRIQCSGYRRRYDLIWSGDEIHFCVWCRSPEIQVTPVTIPPQPLRIKTDAQRTTVRETRLGHTVGMTADEPMEEIWGVVSPDCGPQNYEFIIREVAELANEVDLLRAPMDGR